MHFVNRDPSQNWNEFRCGFDFEFTAENVQHTSWHNLLRHRLECVVTLLFSSILHVVVRRRRLVADVIKRTVFVYIICQWTISPIFMEKLYSTWLTFEAWGKVIERFTQWAATLDWQAPTRRISFIWQHFAGHSLSDSAGGVCKCEIFTRLNEEAKRLIQFESRPWKGHHKSL